MSQLTSTTSVFLGSCEQLVVHVGVSGLATTVTLEQCGHNKGYKRLDNCSFCPASQCCMENGPDCIQSVLDMDAVCKRVNDSGLGVTLSVSKDAGRWVIVYFIIHTYDTAMCQNVKRYIYIYL